MKYKFLILITAFIGIIPMNAQSDYSSKVTTIDSTITNLYKVISGEKGEARDWEIFTFLFKPDAKLIPTGFTKQGDFTARYMSAQEYVNTSGKWLEQNGFYEKEIGRKVHRFGNIAQVFSTYETYKSKADKKPFMRGINSIQLLNDGKRWWIVNIFWQSESKQHPIPKKYLSKKSR